jgi:TusA-related sulfurtransferase
LDVLGQTYPYPVLKTGSALRKLEVGEVLEVLIDFEMSVKLGLPKFCEKHNCKYECVEENSNGKVFWKFYIERSDSKSLSTG